VLARANRVVHAVDFRHVVRRGRRSATPHAVYYRVTRDSSDPMRFGFIVSRAVGDAVTRNRLRRRYRALAREFVDAGGRGQDVVVRALPPAAELSWAELAHEVRDVLRPRS
tara:strand:+ start:60899 stop:61231 length:333 start_codon:yes stop_codon:yes gene_type:complete